MLPLHTTAMNLDTASISSGPTAAPRASRGQIAAQACETCRSRKQKCDEQRPKCSLCQRMKLECRYRESQPTKKDKTLVEILDKLKQIEMKVDRIPTNRRPSSFGSLQPSPLGAPSLGSDQDTASYSEPTSRPSLEGRPGQAPSYRHTSAAHKILTWPAMRQLVQASPSTSQDLLNLGQDGPAFLTQLQRGMPSLPLDDGLLEQPFVGMQSQATRDTGGPRITFPGLTRERMHRSADAYFDTFNLLYPIMDRQSFLSETLLKVQSEGFDGDTESVLALLVFALGEVAIEGSRGPPVGGYRGRPSGIRGGSSMKPPGLSLFNEARASMGYVLAGCALENVQIFSLTALYYQACSRHVEFWRMTAMAASACRVLVTSKPIDWSSPYGDTVQRVYWHCAIMETCLNVELELPLTNGMTELEDYIGMPSFQTPFCEADERGNQSSHFKAHYASQLALRRLCTDVHNSMRLAISSGDSDGVPSASTLNHLSSTLRQWRGMLPTELQWAEEEPAVFPFSPQTNSLGVYTQPLDPNILLHEQSRSPFFTPDLASEPVHYPFAYDIQVALLRTRYYYAKFVVHRPFVYKALHFPEQMTEDDANGVAECLRSCLNWPLVLSPPSRRKRLVPYSFCWSQIFMSVLLIVHLTQHDEMLRRIRAQLCGPRFEAEIDQSVELMIDWIRDLRDCDPIAKWCYDILQPIYKLER